MSGPAIAQGPTPSPTPTTSPPSSPPSATTPTSRALAQAKKNNERVEIEPLRSETATYYANPDGKTLRMELYLEPIRVKNAKGDGFTPIDTTLVEADGVIKPKVVKGDLTLSAGGDATVIMSKGRNTTAQIDAPGKLPKPKLNGSTATYSSVYGKGIDLIVTATPTGFQQEIVIRERPTEPVTFRVPVDLPKGLAFGKNAKGQPTLKSDNGKRTVDIRPAALLDAVAADPNGDLNAAKVGKAAVNLDGSALVYRPDPAFLAHPATAYPVTMAAVDDDWYECTLGNCPAGVGESMDTFVNDVDLTDSWDNFRLDRILVGKSNSGTKRWRSYIQFPLPPQGDPFWGSKIQNADLDLWNYLSHTCGEVVGSGITARRITTDWDELTLTWNSQPSVTNVGADTEYGAYSTDCSGSMNYAHDLIHSVNGIVQPWADGEPNYGIQLTAGNESDLQNWRRYRTREQTDGYPAHGPRLEVDFAIPVTSVYLMETDETRPKTSQEISQWAAAGRVSNTLPQPNPVTNAEDLAYRDASDQDYTAPTDDLELTPIEAPDTGITARWPFSEASGSTAADVSGNNHTATVNSGVSWTPGVSNSALTNVGAGDATRSAPAAESLIPARVAAAQQAAAQNTKVEVTEETSTTSITYAQPGGRAFVTEVAAGPVRVKRNEVWLPIDTSLFQQGGKLTPKVIADGAAVEISNGGTEPFVKMTSDGRSYALRWPTPLPKPTVKGSVATYTAAAGVGADLVVTALPTGFRHDVVLRERPSKPLELRIGVEGDGLTLTEGKGSRLLLKGKDKKLVASAPQPIMWDGSAKGRLPLAKSVKVDTAVAAKDGRTELVLKPDHRFLTDPGTTYPVRMQPMAASTSSEDVSLSSSDTVDWPAYPDGSVMIAGVQTGEKLRSYLRFPTGSLQGQTVTDAKLSLYNIESSACGTSVSDGLQVRRVTGAWDVNNLYWANKPTATTEDAQINKAGYSLGCTGGAQRLEWNVTGIAQDWATGVVDHGLVVQSPTESTAINWRYLTASEDTEFNQPPTLTITTSGPASAPTISGPAITPAQSVNGVTVTSSLTPQLAATVADTAGGNLTGEFEVEHDPAATGQGTGQIWAGASPVVTSGSQATVTIPSAKLADGWKIRWRARAANATAAATSAWSAWQTATVDVPNPTVGAFQVTPSQVVNGVTVTTSVTPNLHTTVTDPAAQPVRAEFEVEHDPTATTQGTGQIWAGAVDNVASGAQATLAVPQGKLTDGWKVRWRTRAVNTATTVSSPWAAWQELAVDLPDPVSDPSVGALQVNPSQQVDGTTVTSSLTPALLAQVNNPVGGTLRAEFEVEHDPATADQGAGAIWAGAVDGIAAGAQASMSIPEGKLTDGWKVRWRVRAVAGQQTSEWAAWQLLTVVLPKPGVHDLTMTPSSVVNGTTVTTVTTPTMRAGVTDPQGRPLRAEFEIEHDPTAGEGQGTGSIWATAVDNVASGTAATVVVPAGKLSDGWKIRWRARALAGETASPWSGWQQITIDVSQAGSAPFAQTNGAVLQTDQTFTVAAWLRLTDRDSAYTFLEQRGTHQAPFRIGNDPGHGLVFTMTRTDEPNAAVEGVLSGVKPPVNQWFHLAGVYTKESGSVALYLNGNQIGSSAISFPSWSSTSSMTLGTALTGSLDEVWIFNRELNADEIYALLDGGPTAEIASGGNTAAEQKATIAAAGKYDRITPGTCNEQYGTRRTHGLLKNRFSGCIKYKVAVHHDTDQDDDDTGIEDGNAWDGELLFVAKTFTGASSGLESGATTRDTWFDVYLATGDYSGVALPTFDIGDIGLTVGMRPARNQTACRDVTTFQGSAQQNHVTMDVDAWDDVAEDETGDWKSIATLRFRADPDHAPATRTNRANANVPNPERISNCVFKPYAQISAGGQIQHTITFQYTTSEKDAKVRCDTADYIARTTGGCTMPVVPSIQWKQSSTYEQAYIHYWKACYNQLDTFPKRTSKTMPGCAVNGSGRPNPSQYLWRLRANINNNRSRSETRCHDLWDGYSLASPTVQECDEYPFASVGNRSAAEDQKGTLSVCAMDGGEWGPNQRAGRLLRRLYNNDRILDEDTFFNRFVGDNSQTGAPEPLPKMEDHCWPGHIDRFSRYYLGTD
ncbi:DNRLRE domain-containing protein [Nonomuraea basaltis]|uniref:DNRLRE domain-containing protein n=1 Tax=Nonomuraea basaltis TaxID=2495887 RepID=UPI00110C4C9C|nr:DNRLRE domain-containing protein [Nonomuraea basaltis]TMR90780.1 LamG domain-containing protein [Nonomuraea basaltis]